MDSLTLNRVAKARRFIDFLDNNLPADANIDDIADFDDLQWAEVARLAEERPPSTSTQQCIVTGLRERRRVGVHLLEGLPR